MKKQTITQYTNGTDTISELAPGLFKFEEDTYTKEQLASIHKLLTEVLLDLGVSLPDFSGERPLTEQEKMLKERAPLKPQFAAEA